VPERKAAPPQTQRVRVLFVDDEDAIRVTLPAILQLHGFEVTAVATVADALDEINRNRFHVLLADLNIGQPGDGFTVVSAMRRTQPEAATIIITGYPAFETALQAIRSQVDDYIVKPAKVENLLEVIKRRMEGHVPPPHIPPRRLAVLLQEHLGATIEHWLMLVHADPELEKMPLTNEERSDHIPNVVAEMIAMMEHRRGVVSDEALAHAAVHGRVRRRQGFTIPQILKETRLLRRSIFEVMQANLLAVDVSTLIPDLMQISDSLDVQIKHSIQAYLQDSIEPRAA
jgi:ActR/RegA family two-component response regulator